MLRSMTCFARKEVVTEDFHLKLELKSVNSRFFDFHGRLPRLFNPIEDRIKNFLKSRLLRGRVELYLHYTSKSQEDVAFEANEALAKSYLNAAQELCRKVGIENNLQMAELLSLIKDCIRPVENETDEERLWQTVLPVLEEVCEDALKMSQKEGKALEQDIKAHLQKIDRLISKIKEMFQDSVQKKQKELQERILKRLENLEELDRNRLIQEAAILADKLDINEEVVRLESHLVQFYNYIDAGEQVGRKLDFLVQEIYREANTIASKTSESKISHLVVEIKSELEKIREQLQNVV